MNVWFWMKTHVWKLSARDICFLSGLGSVLAVCSSLPLHCLLFPLAMDMLGRCAALLIDGFYPICDRTWERLKGWSPPTHTGGGKAENTREKEQVGLHVLNILRCALTGVLCWCEAALRTLACKCGVCICAFTLQSKELVTIGLHFIVMSP